MRLTASAAIGALVIIAAVHLPAPRPRPSASPRRDPHPSPAPQSQSRRCWLAHLDQASPPPNSGTTIAGTKPV